jgi:serine/threonine-protein kinase
VSNPLLDTLRSSLGREYAIERELGGGGMARVFLAEERSLGRRVVLKVLPPDAAGSVSAERFKREVQVAARLQHPHIVPLISAGEVNGIPYYTMPYIEGESLRARIAREHELPIAVAVRILREVADALAYAHSNNVVHRDIKPDNVLLADQHALVADFGIAKAIATARAASTSPETAAESITQLGVALGTPAYMAPEQASADPNVDHRADIYALGVLGYELLTGRPPFTGHSPQALLAAVISADARPITELRTTVPPALGQLIMRCLEKRPADRPQSAAEVLHELEAQSTPTGTLSAGAVRPQRNLWPVAALAVVIVAAAAFGMFRMRRAAVSASASSIAVMPFAPASADTALSRLGRDLVVTISANLDGVGPIRAVDPLLTLGLADSGGRISLSAAVALAKRVGARSFVSGTLIRVAGRVRLDLAQYATDAAGEPFARASVEASPDSITALTDSASWALLRQVWRHDTPPTPTIGSITSRSIPALRAYIDGEKARADGRWPDAWAAYDRAIAADSNFWLAYWRAAQSRAWMLQPVDTVYRRYRRHVAELPERDRLFLAVDTFPRLTQRLAAWQRLADRFPDDPQIWETMGDRILHEGGPLGYTMADSRQAFEHVVTLNPGLSEAWQHLYFIALDANGFDSPSADSAIKRLRALGYDSSSTRTFGYNELAYYSYLARGAKGDRAAIDTLARWVRHSRLRGAMIWAITVAPQKLTKDPKVQSAYSEAVLRQGSGDAHALESREAMLDAWASRGVWDSLLVGERPAADAPPGELNAAFRLAATAEFVGAAPRGSTQPARAQLEGMLLTLPPNSRAQVAWFDGVTAHANRDTAALGAARRTLQRITQMDTASGRRPSYATLLDRSLAAFQAEAGGRRRAAADSLASVEWDLADYGYTLYTAPIARFTSSRWKQATGDLDGAAKLLLWTEGLTVSRVKAKYTALFEPLVYLERARIDEARGRVADARRLYSEFLRRYDMPPDAHKPLIVEARAALARLAKKGG